MFFLFYAITSLFTLSLFGIDCLLEAEAAYYYPTSDDFREIYSGSGIYGLELSVQSWRNLYPWISGNIFVQSSHSIGLKNNTEIFFIPIGVGLKYLYNVKFGNLYLGAGALPTYLHIHDHSHFVTRTISKWGCGGIIKSGIIINLPKSFFLNIFTNYSYIKIPYHNTWHDLVYTNSANLSGLSFGGALGYRFGAERKI